MTTLSSVIPPNNLVTTDNTPNILTANNAQTVSNKVYNEKYAAVTSSSNSVNIDCSTGNSFSHTLTENTTIDFINEPAANTSYTCSLEVIQDSGATGYTVTWANTVIWPSATAPTLTATANAIDVFVFSTKDGGTTWYGFTAGQALG